MGHKQISFIQTNAKFSFTHGGILRQKRAGRGGRPLTTKGSLHVVLKARKILLKSKSFRSPQTFSKVQFLIRKYAKRFFIKIEEISIQHDHIHLLIRCSRRSFFHHFFRVVAGQIAQNLQKDGLLIQPVTDTPKTGSEKGTRLWIYRPFSAVKNSWRAIRIACAYIRLNEKEVLNQIPYWKTRLRGLSAGEWELLSS